MAAGTAFTHVWRYFFTTVVFSQRRSSQKLRLLLEKKIKYKNINKAIKTQPRKPRQVLILVDERRHEDALE